MFVEIIKIKCAQLYYRAMVTWKVKLDNHHEWDHIRKGKDNMQLTFGNIITPYRAGILKGFKIFYIKIIFKCNFYSGPEADTSIYKNI